MQNNFKIALIGYGKMGKEIHKIAKSQNIEVTDIFDENRLLTPQKEFNFDVAIDFSIPPAVIDNAKIVSACGKNLVIGTTGWYKNSDLVKAVAEQNIQYCLGFKFFSRHAVVFQNSSLCLTTYYSCRRL